MDAEEFEKVTGCKPEQDDLARANCSKAGQLGHTGCGICEHGKPVFGCHPCFVKAVAKAPSVTS